MSSKLAGKSREADQKEQAGQTLGRVKAVNEFLADVLEAVKDTGLTDAVAEAAPWLGAVGESLAESVAPIRFVVKLFESLTRSTIRTSLAIWPARRPTSRQSSSRWRRWGLR